MRYLSKYMSKVWDSDKATGRVWGIWGDIDQIEYCTIDIISEKDWIEFVRRVRRWGKRSRYLRRVKKHQGFTLYGDGLSLDMLGRGIWL